MKDGGFQSKMDLLCKDIPVFVPQLLASILSVAQVVLQVHWFCGDNIHIPLAAVHNPPVKKKIKTNSSVKNENKIRGFWPQGRWNGGNSKLHC